MAVLRRNNTLSQERIDLPYLRSIESAVSADFDQLIQSWMTGPGNAYVINGFYIIMSGAIGGAANGLQMSVANGSLFHTTASQSGTFFLVPAGTPNQTLNGATNTNVSGAFSPNSLNYVGIDYLRYLDPATDQQFYLWDPSSNSETTTTAPAANVLEYEIVISTTPWPSNVLPIAIVNTDSGNNVTSITDSRNLLFRLGTGGASPNPFYQYPAFTAENPVTSSSSSVDPFNGGDKNIGTQKEWMNAVMTAIENISGSTYWYLPSPAGSIAKLREDLGNTITTSAGTIEHSASTPGLINWSNAIYFKVIGSSLAYELSANPSSTDISLANGQVAYITLSRDVAISPNLLFTYNSVTNTTAVTSIGSVAWTTPLAAGDFIRAAADEDSLYTIIQSVDSLTQVTLTGNYVPSGQTSSGQQVVYALGTYNAVTTSSTARDIYITSRASVPTGQNIFWLFSREDNGGSVARVYCRMLGLELEQGETEQIDSSFPLAVLSYIGSSGVGSANPQYVSAIDPGSVSQIVSLTTPAEASITSNQYFTITNSGSLRTYYVWFNVNGTGSDPAPNANWIGVQVTISTGQTAAQVATAIATALNGIQYDDFAIVNPNTGSLTITNNSAGTANVPTTGTMPGGFSISVTRSGTGIGNNFINDGDNLTLAIKKLDDAWGSFLSSIDSPSYDEDILISTTITSGSNITIPVNSRISGSPQEHYTVGNGTLELFLNGQYLKNGIDWAEVGSSETSSDTIQILINLYAGDILAFRTGGGGGGGGFGAPGPQGPQGPAGPTGANGADAAGGPVAISTKTSSYSVMTSDNVLLADCTSGAIIFTLPTPSAGVGKVFYFKKIDSSANAMTIIVNGGALIDGASSLSSTLQYEAFTIMNSGTQYYIF